MANKANDINKRIPYTPTISALGGTAPTYTSSGEYTMIGSMVTLTGAINFTANGMAGQVRIVLPFRVVPTSIATIRHSYIALPTNYTTLIGFAVDDGSNLRLDITGNNMAAAALGGNAIANNAVIYFSLVAAIY